MLSSNLIEVREYIDGAGRSPFAKWFRALNEQAAAKVATALERLADGNLSSVRSVGAGVLEYKIDFGPGYRIDFGRDGGRLVILLARRRKEAPTAGHPERKGQLGRLSATQSIGSQQWH